MCEPQNRMTSDKFIAWPMEQPDSEHYELAGGEIVATAPERSVHALTKFQVARPSADAIDAGSLPCQVYRSRSAGRRDTGLKLAGYFRLPSVRHYLILRTEDRTIVHHQRDDCGTIHTRIVQEGPIILNPPGITLTDCFPPGVA